MKKARNSLNGYDAFGDKPNDKKWLRAAHSLQIGIRIC